MQTLSTDIYRRGSPPVGTLFFVRHPARSLWLPKVYPELADGAMRTLSTSIYRRGSPPVGTLFFVRHPTPRCGISRSGNALFVRHPAPRCGISRSGNALFVRHPARSLWLPKVYPELADGAMRTLSTSIYRRGSPVVGALFFVRHPAPRCGISRSGNALFVRHPAPRCGISRSGNALFVRHPAPRCGISSRGNGIINNIIKK